MKRYDPGLAVPTLKMFLYGDSGTGKTTFIASAMDDPRTSPMLMLTCAGNPESIRKRKTLPAIFELESTIELNPVYEWLQKGQPDTKWAVDQGLMNGTGPYKSVAIDSVTEYQRIAMDEVLGLDRAKMVTEMKVADERTWGLLLSRVSRVVRLFYRLDMSVFISGLEKTDMDKEGNVLGIKPLLWGQAKDEVPSYSLLTMRMQRLGAIAITTERKKYEGSTVVGMLDEPLKFVAKDQYGMDGKPKAMGDPTVPKVMDLIYGPATVAAPKTVAVPHAANAE